MTIRDFERPPVQERDHREPRPWHTLSSDEVLSRLGVDREYGLTGSTLADRAQEFGPNELIERGVKNPWLILWEQLTAIMVVILIIAAIVSALLGDFKDAIAIVAIVVLNAVLGFTQEYRAEQAMAALKKLAVPTVKVRREGHIREISARELVPGDIVLVEAGALVPADLRLIEAANLRAQESALTGESEPVEKSSEALPIEDLPVADRSNMVYMGTVVTYGRGVGVVVHTGMNTELGNIAELIQAVEREPTPLQRRLDQLARGLAVAALGIVTVVFVLGILRGEDLRLMFLTAISMAVAAVPEGLPAVVTISLALGAQRMLRRHALIRKLPAVETLGSVTVICSDKTGTLTENRMTVTVLDVLGETQQVDTLLRAGVPVIDAELKPEQRPPVRSLGLLVKAAALCNDAALENVDGEEGRYRTIGDPTEGALLVAAANFGLMKPELDKRWPRVGEAPFSSERKRMTTIHQVNVARDETDAPWRDAPIVAFCKGAVDGLVEISEQIWAGDEAVPMTNELSERILKANEELAKQGQRVLGVAFRPLDDQPEKPDEAELERQMTFIGLIGMIDPPRPEVKDAVHTSQTAGIRPVMITGDHPATALQIAKELSIAKNGKLLTGQDLARKKPGELEKIVEQTTVYARVSPEHKLRIVEALQKLGHVVAMTGDGVNDAPALKKADIGIAMGIRGTAVAKEAAEMVLQDDDFGTIVLAIGHGRAIFQNIRKFVIYLLSCNTSEVLVVSLATLAGAPLPLLPLQILFLNLVTDVFPALALGVGPGRKSLMRRKPRLARERILDRGHWIEIGIHGVILAAVTLCAMAIGMTKLGFSLEKAVTVAFCTIALAQLWHVFNMRGNMRSVVKNEITRNPWIWVALAVCLGLILAAVWTPLLSGVLRLVDPGAAGWLLILLFSLAPLAAAPLVRQVTDSLR